MPSEPTFQPVKFLRFTTNFPPTYSEREGRTMHIHVHAILELHFHGISYNDQSVVETFHY